LVSNYIGCCQAFCFGVTITATATLLQAVEVHLVGQAYLETLVLAILLGVVVRATWTPQPRFLPGVAFSAKFLLECAVVMLCASVSSERFRSSGRSS
jgi:uncharacterized membrane protein YadS